MMRRTDWPVLHDSIRPAGPPDRCFYCEARLGDQHKADCPMRQRTVVIRAAVVYTIAVPEHWDAGMIDFSRNEGSACAGQLVYELCDVHATDQEPDEPDTGRRNCLCGQVKFRYLREATPEDEERDGVRVADCET
jgi:hypothetical protein